MALAICAARSLELLVAVFGILEAGGAFVPLDPEDPAPRLAFKLADCRAPVVVAQRHLLERLPASGLLPEDPETMKRILSAAP